MVSTTRRSALKLLPAALVAGAIPATAAAIVVSHLPQLIAAHDAALASLEAADEAATAAAIRIAEVINADPALFEVSWPGPMFEERRIFHPLGRGKSAEGWRPELADAMSKRRSSIGVTLFGNEEMISDTIARWEHDAAVKGEAAEARYAALQTQEGMEGLRATLEAASDAYFEARRALLEYRPVDLADASAKASAVIEAGLLEGGMIDDALTFIRSLAEVA